MKLLVLCFVKKVKIRKIPGLTKMSKSVFDQVIPHAAALISMPHNRPIEASVHIQRLVKIMIRETLQTKGAIFSSPSLAKLPAEN